MRKTIRNIAIIATAAVGVSILTGCGYVTEEGKNYEERKELAAQYDTKHSLELANLKEKRSREDDPDAIRYLYLMSYGDIVGYYVTKGKISSNDSQIAPESEVINVRGELFLSESAKDDGAYGPGDPGVFFFTTDGVMVETSLDYVMSDAPLAIDTPRLG